MTKPSIRELLRYVYGLKPHFVTLKTMRLCREKPIEEMNEIAPHFMIRQITLEDASALEKAYQKRSRGYYKRNGLPRLKDPSWIGLAVFDIRSGEIAYVSWIIQRTVVQLEDIGLYLKDSQRYVKDVYCVPEYRHQGLHTRMDLERINHCIRDGASEIFLQVEEKNTKGVRSVTDNGFKYTGQTLKYLVIPSLGVFREYRAFLRSLLGLNSKHRCPTIYKK